MQNTFELHTSYGKSLGQFTSSTFCKETSGEGEYEVSLIGEGYPIVKVIRDTHTDYFFDKDDVLVSYND